MGIEVIYCPQLDKAIVSRPDYPGEPTKIVFSDGRYSFEDGRLPF